MQTIRIFISSPEDVAEERDRAKEVIRRLQRRYTRRLELVPILWEEMFLDAETSFQQGIDQILDSENCIDIAVFILWSRLGSPLGSRVLRNDGTQYNSGTEREFDLILQARQQAKERGIGDRPAILAYFRDDDKGFKTRLFDQPADNLEEAIHQSRRAKEFIEEHFYDKKDGTNKRAFTIFDAPSSFAAKLRVHLQNRLDEYVQDAKLHKEGWDIAERGAPYRGLEIFDIEHEQIFFGREQEVSDIQVLLGQQAERGQAFVLLVGASGSGKSSLARAGVIPAIRHYDSTLVQCRYAVMTPAEHAENLIEGLAKILNSIHAIPELFHDTQSQANLVDFTEALMDNPITAVKLTLLPAIRRIQEKEGGKVRLILLIDQLEELFTISAINKNEIDTFACAIGALAASGSVWVMATIRSDFYSELQQHSEWMDLKGAEGQYDVVPLGAAHMHRVITEPAWLAGLQFEENTDTEERLDQRILSDALEEPDALPLLQYTLRELYENRIKNNVLTFSSYQNLGGVTGALGKRAEAVWNGLPVEAREKTVPRLFRALVTIEGKRQFGAKILTTDQVQDGAVLEAFIQARLLITASHKNGSISVVRLAHEAIIRSWPRLQQWLEDARDFLQARARLESVFNRWEEEQEKEVESKKANDYLLPEGKPLAEAQDLLTHWHKELRPELQKFIARSEKYHEKRRKKRLRIYQIASGVFLMLTTLAIISGTIALSQSNKASSTLQLSLQSADKLAIEVVEQLHEAWDTPSTEKMRLASTIDKRFGTLVGDITGSTYLSRSYCRLLTSVSEMALGLGFIDQASYYAKRATQLHDRRQDSNQPDILIEEAQSLVALAEAAEVSFDNPMAANSIERAILKLDKSDLNIKDSLLAQYSRLIRARAKTVQVYLFVDRGELIKAIELNTVLLEELRELQKRASIPKIGRKATLGLLTAHEVAKMLQTQSTIKLQVATELKSDFEQGQTYFNDSDSTHYQLFKKRFDLMSASSLQNDGKLGAGISLLDEITPFYDKLLVNDPNNREWKRLLVKNLSYHQSIADKIGLNEIRDMDAITKEALLAQLRVDGPLNETTWWSQFFYHNTFANQLKKDAKKLKKDELSKKTKLYNLARNQYSRMQTMIDMGMTLGAETEQLGRARFYLAYGLINTDIAEKKWDDAEKELRLVLSEMENPTTVEEAFINFWLLKEKIPLLDYQDKILPEAVFDDVFTAIKKLQEFGVPDLQNTRNYLHRVRASQFHSSGEDEKAFEAIRLSLEAINRASQEQPLTCSDVQATLWSLSKAFFYLNQRDDWDSMSPLISVAKDIAQNIPKNLPCAGQEKLVKDWRSMCHTLGAQTGICKNDLSPDSANDLCIELSLTEKGLREGLDHLRQFDTVIAQYSTPDFAPFPALTEKQLLDVRRRAAELRTRPWVSKPLMLGKWRELKGDEFSKAVESFVSLERFKNVKIGEAIARVREAKLASFPRAKLFEAEYATYSGLTPILSLLVAPNKVYELKDHYSYVIKTTDELSIQTKEAAADYIRFYFAHVQGRHGRFVIVESEKDVPWLPEATSEHRRKIGEEIHPVAMKANPKRIGYWTGTVTMMLKDTIFNVPVYISPGGNVSMGEHTIITEGEDSPVIEDHLRYTASGYITERDTSIEFATEVVGSIPTKAKVWNSPPTMQGSWRTLIGREYVQALEKLNKVEKDGLPPGLLRSPVFQIRAFDLPFYKDSQLLEAEYVDSLGATPVVSVLSTPSGIKYLNGTSPLIHDTNKAQALSLNTSDIVAAYLRFFNAYVHGDKGPFHVVEWSEELPWAEGATIEDKKQVANLLLPLTVIPDSKKPGHWLANATIQYSNTLFRADFRIFPGGMVEMLTDNPLASNLPIMPLKITKRGQINIKGAKRLQSVNFTTYEGILKDEIDKILKKPKQERPSHWRELVSENMFYEMRGLGVGDKAKSRLNNIVDIAVDWWENAQDALKSDSSITLSSAENIRTKKFVLGLLDVASEVAETVDPDLKRRIEKERARMIKSQGNHQASL